MGGKAGECWDRVVREGLTKKIYLSEDLNESEQGMQVFGERAASAKVPCREGGGVGGEFEEWGPDETKEKKLGYEVQKEGQ